ncbi:Do family serine endopeptidase [Tunicatimonas pelagia]|uniref:Do family serine endopeptidase n=1 Tax=Tunicatimonas pelagia TaxID=931531 RepID=UPI002666F319|nr:Do family serine endopeptidase [Tunicatimonas pelagia]WKN44814.1 Do family serine endopeptidase [Tunicatimonas pelagia]
MSQKKFAFGIILAAILGGLVSVGITNYLGVQPTSPYASFDDKQQGVQYPNVNFLADSNFSVPDGINFVYAADRVKPGVVFIRSTYSGSRQSRNSLLEDFYDYFGDRRPGEPGGERPSRSSGSGVLISDDGYIVTNNHVIEEADKIEVTLDDNRFYEAEVIGIDPTTDLALLKIEDRSILFPFVSFGDSDDVRVGEWVLAIGNPFGTLTSTVTAGIVSAKARNINILHDRNGRQIESFIQTDAAVNQGNSGGALVNLKGELVGINTAIATPTGSYAGYSFAVPVSLVQKVMNDLLEYGSVQRALLGVRIRDVNAQLAEEEGLKTVTGVFVDGVTQESAAAEAGMEAGDVIIEIDDRSVNNVSELQELVARNRPGDEVEVTFWRDGSQETVYATLKNTMGNTEMVQKVQPVEFEGGTFGDIPSEILDRFELEGGAQLIELSEGKWKKAGLEEGFIITSIDKTPIQNAKELEEVMQNKAGGILIEGLSTEGERSFHGFGW